MSDDLADGLPYDEVDRLNAVDDRADNKIRERLEYLRTRLRAECISYGELAELQGLSDHIDPNDMELREAAGIPEHPIECVDITYTVTLTIPEPEPDDIYGKIPAEHEIRDLIYMHLAAVDSRDAILVERVS